MVNQESEFRVKVAVRVSEVIEDFQSNLFRLGSTIFTQREES